MLYLTKSNKITTFFGEPARWILINFAVNFEGGNCHVQLNLMD